MKRKKLKFSANKNFNNNIQLAEKEKTGKISLIDTLFINNFKIQKDKNFGNNSKPIRLIIKIPGPYIYN